MDSKGGSGSSTKAGVAIVLDDALAVRGEAKGNVEQIAVSLRLLETLAGDRVLALGLDDGDRHARSVLEHVVCAKWLLASMLLAVGDDPPVCDRELLDDLVVDVPTSGPQARQHVVATGV